MTKIFLFFEEIDLCRRVKNKNGKIYLDKRILINHIGGSSVNRKNFELEKIEIGTGCGQLFIIIKNTMDFKSFNFSLSKVLSTVIKTIIYFY